VSLPARSIEVTSEAGIPQQYNNQYAIALKKYFGKTKIKKELDESHLSKTNLLSGAKFTHNG
jgi:hypothetical protein